MRGDIFYGLCVRGRELCVCMWIFWGVFKKWPMRPSLIAIFRDVITNRQLHVISTYTIVNKQQAHRQKTFHATEDRRHRLEHPSIGTFNAPPPLGLYTHVPCLPHCFWPPDENHNTYQPRRTSLPHTIRTPNPSCCSPFAHETVSQSPVIHAVPKAEVTLCATCAAYRRRHDLPRARELQTAATPG